MNNEQVSISAPGRFQGVAGFPSGLSLRVEDSLHDPTTRKFSPRTARLRLRVPSAIGAMLICAALAPAQDVELNPGFIVGDVQIGTTPETNITRADMFAFFGPFSATQNFTPSPPSNTVSYDLTVNVPAGTSPEYQIRANNVWMDGFRDRISFPNQPVVVNEFETSTVDFVIADPGFIEGTITVSGGGSLNSASIVAQQSAAPFIVSRTSTDSSESGFYRFPVFPTSPHFSPDR